MICGKSVANFHTLRLIKVFFFLFLKKNLTREPFQKVQEVTSFLIQRHCCWVEGLRKTNNKCKIKYFTENTVWGWTAGLKWKKLDYSLDYSPRIYYLDSVLRHLVLLNKTSPTCLFLHEKTGSHVLELDNTDHVSLFSIKYEKTISQLSNFLLFSVK